MKKTEAMLVLITVAASLSALGQSNPVDAAIARRKAAIANSAPAPPSSSSQGFLSGPGAGTANPDGSQAGSNAGQAPYALSATIGVTNGAATITLQGTSATNFYQLWSTTNLAWIKNSLGLPVAFWTPGEILEDTNGESQLSFDPVPTTNAVSFFTGVSGVVVVRIDVTQYSANPIVEPSSPGQTNTHGYFTVTITDSTNGSTLPYDLPVGYRIGGTASNGVDYAFLPGTVTIPANTPGTNLVVGVLYDPKLDFDETVMVTLLPTNGVLAYPTTIPPS